MTRRKINLQQSARREGSGDIDKLVRDMGSSDMGFVPTDQTVYEVDLERVKPDFAQARHLLPYDLRDGFAAGKLTAHEAMAELARRAEQGDQLALLILGGQVGLLDEEGYADDDKGLLSLANSIREVGLRQPLNVYRVTDPDDPAASYYQIGEGERRYWAHVLLDTQGYKQFARIRCIIEPLPPNRDIIQRRQEAENAARQDLSAVARARAIKGIRNRLSIELGTRVPGQATIKLPSQRQLDEAVGQEVKTLTGRAISDRMVRNYMRLLNLSPANQDLAEAAQLTEKQLRSVMRLSSDDEQGQMIRQTVREKLSGQDVLARVQPALPRSSLRRTTSTTLEQRLEKRLFQTAKTVHEILTLGQDSYSDIIQSLVGRLSDQMSREALLTLRQAIDDLCRDFDGVPASAQQVYLDHILPPLDLILPHLAEAYQSILTEGELTGLSIGELLLEWRRDDPLAASALNDFFDQVEAVADQLLGRETRPKLVLQPLTDAARRDRFEYELFSGEVVFWAHVSLVLRGHQNFEKATVEIVGE